MKYDLSEGYFSPVLDNANRRLLQIEQKLVDQDADHHSIQKEIWDDIARMNFIRTSKELDTILQLIMIYIGTCIVEVKSTFNLPSLRLAICIYNSRHQVLVVKPSSYYVGKCIAFHPTIALHDPDARGQTTLAFLRGEFLFCKEGGAKCRRYLPINLINPNSEVASEDASTSLCIPIRGDHRKAAEQFAEFLSSEKSLRCNMVSECKARMTQSLSDDEETHETLGALCIEASHAHLTSENCCVFLRNEKFNDALECLHRILKTYPAERDRYRTLKACSSFFDLSQHNLQPRQGYECLLREISEICDGADVTLHLCQKPDRRDEGYLIQLVEGVGRNFRGFLIGDQHTEAYGTVGRAIRTCKHAVTAKAEIDSSREQYTSKRFRQLMPGTVLNLAIPLPTIAGGTPLGAINVEWDDCALGGDEAPDSYVRRKLPMLNEMCGYVSLVVDHYQSEARAVGGDGEFRYGRGDQRLSLGYYLHEAIHEIRLELANRADPKEYLATQAYLREIIDEAGYLLSYQRNVQFLLLFRSFDASRKTLVLNLKAHSGHIRSLLRATGEAAPPVIQVTKKGPVTAFTAEVKVPIFGEIAYRGGASGEAVLVPALECRKIYEESRGCGLPGEILYKGIAGWKGRPIFEVAVPVYFNGVLKGILNFEQFLPAGVSDELYQKRKESLEFDLFHLDRFREWARAVAFLIAFAGDQGGSDVVIDRELKGSERYSRAWGRLLDLVALIIGNVPLPLETALSVAYAYLDTLLVVDGIALDLAGKTLKVGSSSVREAAVFKEVEMNYRGHTLGRLDIALSGAADPRARNSLFPFVPRAESVDMVLRLFSAYCTAAVLEGEPGGEGVAQFIRWIEVARSRFSEKWGECRFSTEGVGLDAGKVLQKGFLCLHSALGAALTEGSGEYGWFLYLRESQLNGDYLVAEVDGKRMMHLNLEREISALGERIRDGGGGWNGFARVLREEPWLWEREPWKNTLRESEAAGVELRRYFLGDGDEIGDWGGPEEGIERSVLEEVIVRELTRPYNVEEGVDEGVTVRSARGEVQCYPDVATSPHRSGRAFVEWFFGQSTHSVMSIPIEVAATSGETRNLGVLHVLRRRERRNDFLFFKNKELAVLQELGALVGRKIAEEVVVEDLSIASKVTPTELGKLGPSAKCTARKVARLFEAENDGDAQRILAASVIISEVARDVGNMDLLLDPAVSENEVIWVPPGDTKGDYARLTGKNVLIRFPFEYAPSQERRVQEVLENILRARPRRIVFLVREEGYNLLKKLKPDVLSLDTMRIEESIEDNWRFWKEYLGTGHPRRATFPRTIDLIARREGCCKWSISKFKEAYARVGVDAVDNGFVFLRSFERWREYRPWGDSVVFGPGLESPSDEGERVKKEEGE